MAPKECSVCLTDHDPEIHAATLRLRKRVAKDLNERINRTPPPPGKKKVLQEQQIPRAALATADVQRDRTYRRDWKMPINQAQPVKHNFKSDATPKP